MPVNKKKKRGPKYLEKMLFVNHKEDQLLQERLDNLHVKSRLREIELDRERIKVRDEWKESRKKQIPIESLAGLQRAPSSAPVISPPRRKLGTVEKPRLLQRQQSTPVSAQSLSQNNKSPSDNVNSFLLGEYRRMSEVIPSILLALSKKDEKKSINDRANYGAMTTTDSPVLEPDLHRITKLVRTVKMMRENMAFRKNIDMNRPKMSLSKMFKDINEKRHEIDQYTDGTCVLIKRKLDKRRRESVVMSDMQSLESTGQNDILGMESGSEINQMNHAFQNESGENTEDTLPEIPAVNIPQPLTTQPIQTRHQAGASVQKFSTVQTSAKRHSICTADNQRMVSPTKRLSISSEIPEPRKRSASIRNSLSSSQRPKSLNQINQRHSIAFSPRPSDQSHTRKRHSVGAVQQRTVNIDFPNLTTGKLRNVGHSSRHLESAESKSNYIDEDEFKAKQRVARELQKFDRIRQKVDKFLATDKMIRANKNDALSVI